MSQKAKAKQQYSIFDTLGPIGTKAFYKASDICLLIDDKGYILDVSSKTFEHLSYWKEQNLRDILTPESVRKIFSYLDVSSQSLNNKKEALELNHKLQDSSEFAISYHTHDTGVSNQSLLTGQSLKEITEIQKQLIDTQIQLEREYETYRAYDVRYRVVLESSTDALAILENQTLKIQDYNERTANILVSGVENIKSTNFSNYFADISMEDLYEKLKDGNLDTETNTAQKLVSGQKVNLQSVVFRSGGDLLLLVKILPEYQNKQNETYNDPIFREFYQKCADPTILTDESGRIVFVNDKFLEVGSIIEYADVYNEFFEKFLERGALDQRVLIETLKSEGLVGTYSTKLKCEHGTNADVEISGSTINRNNKTYFGFILRTSTKLKIVGKSKDAVSDKALENAMKLVGSAPLKDLVSDTSDVVERICIKTALELTRNNRVAAAEMLGLSRQGLYIKLRKYGLLKK